MSSPAQAPVTSVPKAMLAAWCNLYGASLHADLAMTDDGCGKPIDGPRLLWALSGQESSFGQNMKPRHEPAYDVGGRYWRNSPVVNVGIAKYGSAYACSYGPLQIMASNAKGYTPAELGDPEKALAASVAFLRLAVLQRQKARTIAEICESWNGGHVGATTVPGYTEHVERYYATAVMG
jgi:hypothetical protein